MGWYKDDNGELKEAFDFEKETITKSLTLYAKWKAQTYTITFISNGGTAIDHQIVAFRECATRPVSPEKKDMSLLVGIRMRNCSMNLTL